MRDTGENAIKATPEANTTTSAKATEKTSALLDCPGNIPSKDSGSHHDVS